MYGQLGHQGERKGERWELVPVYLEKKIYDIEASGDQSFAVEGLSVGRLGQMLITGYQTNIKNNDKTLDLTIKTIDNTIIKAHNIILYYRSTLFAQLIDYFMQKQEIQQQKEQKEKKKQQTDDGI